MGVAGDVGVGDTRALAVSVADGDCVRDAFALADGEQLTAEHVMRRML